MSERVDGRAMTSCVVIATRGNSRLVGDAVRSILAGTVMPDELVVVDQSNPVEPEVWALAEAHPRYGSSLPRASG